MGDIKELQALVVRLQEEATTIPSACLLDMTEDLQLLADYRMITDAGGRASIKEMVSHVAAALRGE